MKIHIYINIDGDPSKTCRNWSNPTKRVPHPELQPFALSLAVVFAATPEVGRIFPEVTEDVGISNINNVRRELSLIIPIIINNEISDYQSKLMRLSININFVFHQLMLIDNLIDAVLFFTIYMLHQLRTLDFETSTVWRPERKGNEP